MALTKLTTDLIEGSLGTDWVSTIQTSNFTAVAGKGYFVNTTSAEITVTLPAGVVGAEIVIQDYAGTFATNKVLLNANGSEKIQGSTSSGQIKTKNATATLIYQDATKGWTSQDTSILVPLTVDYLVVAGGGGGGGSRGGNATTYAAGGGGGGYKSNQALMVFSTNYTLTVGSGGSGGIGQANGSDGLSSVFGNVTATGGKAGGNSGGGDSGDSPENSGGTNESSAMWGGGGGGGAGGVGTNGTTSSGGNGGSGYSDSISGTSTIYAGGGGGSAYQSSAGTGGSGGGGNGRGGTNGDGFPGSLNTGGGGGAGGAQGGAGALDHSGGAGGSGIVILRYPNSYTITIPAGLTATTTTVSTDKVTTFTSGTGTIQFN